MDGGGTAKEGVEVEVRGEQKGLEGAGWQGTGRTGPRHSDIPVGRP